MKLYQIAMEVQNILNECIDQKTGEYNPTPMQEAELLQLGIEKDKVMQYLAKEVLNERADQIAIKSEIDRLNNKIFYSEKREHSLLKIIDREAGGEKQDFGIAKWSYRTSHETVIDDDSKALNYLKINHPEFVKVSESYNKSDITKLIDDGEKLEFAHIQDNRKGNLK